MTLFRSILLTGLACLVGTGLHARVSPLRPDGQSEAAEWTRQSPLPAARNLTGVAWATATHGFACGEDLTLVETFDGGATWRDVNLGGASTDPFYNVYCRDGDNCFVIGNSDDHWRTIDGGVTWQRITFHSAVLGITSISFRRLLVLWVQTARRHAPRTVARRSRSSSPDSRVNYFTLGQGSAAMALGSVAASK